MEILPSDSQGTKIPGEIEVCDRVSFQSDCSATVLHSRGLADPHCGAARSGVRRRSLGGGPALTVTSRPAHRPRIEGDA
jgi:hypothetical protein